MLGKVRLVSASGAGIGVDTPWDLNKQKGVVLDWCKAVSRMERLKGGVLSHHLQNRRN